MSRTANYAVSGVNFKPDVRKGNKRVEDFAHDVQPMFYTPNNVRDLLAQGAIVSSLRDPFGHLSELQYKVSGDPLSTAPSAVSGFNYDIPPISASNIPGWNSMYLAPQNFADELYEQAAAGKPGEDLSYLYREAIAEATPAGGIELANIAREKELFDAEFDKADDHRHNARAIRGYRDKMASAQAQGEVTRALARVTASHPLINRARQVHKIGVKVVPNAITQNVIVVPSPPTDDSSVEGGSVKRRKMTGSGVVQGESADQALLRRYTGEVQAGNYPNHSLGLELSALLDKMERRQEITPDQKAEIDQHYVQKLFAY